MLTKKNLFIFLLFALTIYLIHPYLYSLSWGGIFAIVLFPLSRKLQVKNQLVASLIITGGFALVILIPVICVFYFAVTELSHYISQKDILEHPQAFVQETISNLPYINQMISPKTIADKMNAENISKMLPTAKNISVYISNLILGVIFSILFLFNFLLYNKPIKNFFMTQVFSEFKNPRYVSNKIILGIRAVSTALLAGAVITGGVMTIVYYVAGVPLPFVFGFVTSFLAMIPFVPVILYAVLTLFFVMKSSYIAAASIFIIGFGLYFFTNNILQPKILQQKMKMKFIISLLGMLAGVEAFGILGLFLGPVILNLCFSFLALSQENVDESHKVAEKRLIKKGRVSVQD